MRLQVILNERSETCHRYPQSHRTRRKVNVIDILCARWVGLRAPKRSKPSKVLFILFSKQILNGMKNRTTVGLNSDTIFWLQDCKVKGSHDGHHGCAGRLVTTYL